MIKQSASSERRCTIDSDLVRSNGLYTLLKQVATDMIALIVVGVVFVFGRLLLLRMIMLS